MSEKIPFNGRKDDSFSFFSNNALRFDLAGHIEVLGAVKVSLQASHLSLVWVPGPKNNLSQSKIMRTLHPKLFFFPGR